ncbi:MAG: EAL domain-containing protein [Comamonas sp.]|nr:EAL domain-containing protein [Comamonas sp.]
MSHAAHTHTPPRPLSAMAVLECLARDGASAEALAHLQTLLNDLDQRMAQSERAVRERTLELQQEIAMREQMQYQLEHLVMHDPLTDLPNRLFIRDQLHRALAGLHRHPERGFALLYLDVDRFKLFNDSLGHQAGDAVLYELAQRLRECVRPTDVVGRLSGDEFAIIVDTGTKPHAVNHVAQRIQRAMQQPMHIAERELQVSVSIGIAIGDDSYRTIDEVLHDADVALYQAKAAGRQRYVFFDEAQGHAALQMLELEQQLRKALQRQEFVPFFQPIVALDSGQVLGYEALIRWQHPERGLLTPGAFLAVAEQTGLMEAIDWQMYRLACSAARPLMHSGRFLTMNVSPRHFQSPNFGQALLQLLQDTGFNPHHLHVEVTETTLLGDPAAVARVLQQLKEAGIGSALDDFGTGYSSLGYVHRFPLAMVKIDRSFTSELGQGSTQPRSAAIIAAVLGLGRALELDVVVEGIETEAQRQTLLGMGCHYGQGFYFGRPQPVEHWLQDPGHAA